MGVPKRKPSKSRQRMRRAYNSVLKLAATQHLPAMRGALHPSSGLPGVRLLQGTPGPDCHGRSLIRRVSAVEGSVRALSILCELQWMSWVATTVAGSSSKAPSALWKPTSDHRAFPGRATRPKSTPLCRSRGFRDHRVRVVHASEVLTMEDKPVAAVRKKKDSSIVRAIELVHEGKADAIISLGNTGGIFAAATFKLGRLQAWIARHRHGHSHARQRFCPARCGRQHRVQAAAPGALCRHGQRLCARDPRAARIRAWAF